MRIAIKIKKLSQEAIVPTYQTLGASGFDFHALEDVMVFAGETVLIRTGLSFELPEGYELQVRPRSGLSLKSGLRIPNSPGTIDSDYRGEVMIMMENTRYNEYIVSSSGEKVPAYRIKRGDRIAQGVICPVLSGKNVLLLLTDNLSDTSRDSGGFGSTGE